MTAKPFLITGLPRSRTAWLSVLCSTSESICYHEPSVGVSDIADIEGIFQSEFFKYVGISDSTLGFFLPWILEHIKPRTLIVARDPREVAESGARLGLTDTNFLDLLSARLTEFREHPLVMWVPFEALKTKRVIQKIYWHLMPGHAFGEDRYEELAKMRIETDFDAALMAARRNQKNFNVLMRDILPLIEPKAGQNAKQIH
jgi:hypothetical protein